MMNIYPAGGDGFTLEGRKYHEELLEELENQGYDTISPWCSGGEDAKELREQAAGREYSERVKLMEQHNEEVFEDNVDMIDDADVILANLNGADVDSGTAWEVGYAFATDTPVVGYRTDFRTGGDNEGCDVNIMVEQSSEKLVTLEDYRGPGNIGEIEDEFQSFVEEIDRALRSLK